MLQQTIKETAAVIKEIITISAFGFRIGQKKNVDLATRQAENAVKIETQQTFCNGSSSQAFILLERMRIAQ